MTRFATIDRLSGPKTYVGDGVYARLAGGDDRAGGALVLTSENGEEVLNRIVFEREVWAALAVWLSAQGWPGETEP